MKTTFTLLAFLFTLTAAGQTCDGEIVKFQETFGAGSSKASLPNGRTNYNYNGSSALNDGDYVLYNSTQAKPEWHSSPDHTGDLNGRMMVTNASYSPGEFYRDTVYGVSSVSTYNIYFYAMNVNTVGTCSPNPILPQLQLIVEAYNFDGSFTQIYSLVSNFIPQSSSPQWVKISGQFYLPTACTAVRYRIINNSTGGCGNDLAIDDITFSQCNPTILPVTGLALRADENELSWSTLREKNTEKFVVERSMDNTSWKAIGTIRAAGESETKKSYVFTDKAAGSRAFYRIVSLDKDGKSFYSNVVVTKSRNSNSRMSVYPNPASAFVNLDLSMTEAGLVNIRIMDLSGRLTKTISWPAKKGDNSIRISDLQSLSKGMYFITISGKDGSIIGRQNLVRQ